MPTRISFAKDTETHLLQLASLKKVSQLCTKLLHVFFAKKKKKSSGKYAMQNFSETVCNKCTKQKGVTQ
jgi:hypothetical protein